MQLKKKLICSAMLCAGAITFTVPVIAGEKMASKHDAAKISLVAGHNVVDAVDDLRETTADLIGAVLEAKDGLALSDWKNKEAQLNKMESKLEQMEVTLDSKAEATDSSWLNWFKDPDYSVTVNSQIRAIGDQLDSVATMLKESSKNASMELVAGHNLVTQVDDVRETTGDLLNAINDAGPQWGWFNDNDQFEKSMALLDDMEKTLDAKAAMTDDQWGMYISSPEYRVTVHKQVDTLANMVNGLADRIRTDVKVSQVN